MRSPTRIIAVVMATLLVTAVAGCSLADGSTLHSATLPPESTQGARQSTGVWLSGASGNGVPGGQFGQWRGRSVEIAGTWSDTDDNAQHFWQLQSGGDLEEWGKPLDIAVGAIGDGQSWAQAAKGAYDAQWVSSLEKLRAARAETKATTYIRFAHEMNGNWYPWQVNSRNYKDFVASWKRYRALQQQIFPSSKLVFSLNRQSNGTRMDWRRFFPGAQYVDLIGVDYYNQYPYVSTSKAWSRSLDLVDQWGAPNGLAQYLEFARSKGLPLAIPEWSGVATFGDSPVFVNGLLRFVASHSGTRAGQIPYEILFDVPQDSDKFTFYGDSIRMPQSSEAYRSYFRSRD